MGHKPSKEELMEAYKANIQESLVGLAMEQVQLERSEKGLAARLEEAVAKQNTSLAQSLAKSRVKLQGRMLKLADTIQGISNVRAEVAVMQVTMASLESINALTNQVTGVENVDKIRELVNGYKNSCSDLTAQSAMLDSAFDTSSETESEAEKAAVAEMIDSLKDKYAMQTACNMPSVPHGRGLNSTTTMTVEGGVQDSEQQMQERVRKLDV
jgi:hypothetical protein